MASKSKGVKGKKVALSPAEKKLMAREDEKKALANESNNELREQFGAKIKKIEDDTNMDSARIIMKQEELTAKIDSTGLPERDKKEFKKRLKEAVDNRQMEETCEKWMGKLIMLAMMAGPVIGAFLSLGEFVMRPSMVLHQVELQGQSAIVTGGCDGMGLVTASLLVQSGASVLLGCPPNRSKMDAAVRHIKLDTGVSGDYISAWPLDLANLTSVRSFAQRYATEVKDLQLLVNNAGSRKACETTTDNLEHAWQVNFVGPFLLTELLVPSLVSSAPSRVVHVTCDEGVSTSGGGPWPLPKTVGVELGLTTQYVGEVPLESVGEADKGGATPATPPAAAAEADDFAEDDELEEEPEPLPEAVSSVHIPEKVLRCDVARQYAGAKLALLAYSVQLDRHFRRIGAPGEGVTSHAINPGRMLTDFEAKGTPLPVGRGSTRARIMGWFPPFYIMGWVLRSVGGAISGVMTRTARTGALGVYHVSTSSALETKGGGLYSDQSGTGFVGCDLPAAECGKMRKLPPQVKDKTFRQELRAVTRPLVERFLPKNKKAKARASKQGLPPKSTGADDPAAAQPTGQAAAQEAGDKAEL